MTDHRFCTLKDLNYDLSDQEKRDLARAIDLMPADGPAPTPEQLPYFTAWYVIYSLLEYIRFLEASAASQ